MSGPVQMFVNVYHGIPKSWSRNKKIDAIADVIYPTTKPDIDNILKGIMDALKGIVWKDDAQVVIIEAMKEYGEFSRVEMIIEEIEQQ